MQPLAIGIIAAAAAVAKAENIAVALNSDINANLAEYLSVIQEQTGDAVTQLMALYAAGKTYTDNSYTTLIDSAEYAMLSSFVTELPWYSSRLETAIQAEATTTTSESSSAAPSESSSAAPSESSSAAPSQTSSVAPNESSSVAPTSSRESSSSASSSTASSSSETSASSITETSSSTAGANALIPGAFAGAFIGAFALL